MFCWLLGLISFIKNKKRRFDHVEDQNQAQNSDSTKSKKITSVNPDTCPNCGTWLNEKESIKYCPYCGITVSNYNTIET
jgi:rubrerythrin